MIISTSAISEDGLETGANILEKRPGNRALVWSCAYVLRFFKTGIMIGETDEYSHQFKA